MEDLIKALQILLKYGNPRNPTVCVHDELVFVGIDAELISKEDIKELQVLGVEVEIEGVYDEETGCESEESKIYSYRYGSA